MSSSKKNDVHRFYDRPPAVSPECFPWEDQAAVDSTTTLLHTHDTRDAPRIDADVTFNFDQVVSSNSPESCWTYLMNLEKRGSPHTDINLLNKLKDCYSKIFSRMPIRQFSKNTSYARILVRYAELKGIEDADEAQDHFIVARSNCKGFAFVHVAHAQFEVGTLNYMPPEAIKDTSSQAGKARSKISPKGDVWSLGCILYCMTYGKTPFQSITNQIAKLHAIIDTSHRIEFPDIAETDLLDVLKRCLVRNPRERISIAELLEHQYLQLKPQVSPGPECPTNRELQKILMDLAALQSPNSIVRAANNLAKMCNSGGKLDVAECAKSST
ncbi:Dual specificity protein kinase Ttk [Liparis tanakae]|uniref:Dual specificity protein kinase Ttk n=1 Tax=Liparis tanakae TaxID=230148 RepID=A0A4Z2H712_9TELE|nr:Dual specificity protein kinase Ttk [Liparis tanakae]